MGAQMIATETSLDMSLPNLISFCITITHFSMLCIHYLVHIIIVKWCK